MSNVSLSRIITEKFITRIAAATEKAAGSSSSANPLKAGSSKVSLSGSLRLGAQTYATAVQGLNNTLSIVNISKDTLEKLGDITDKMIDVAEQAATRPIGPHGRRALDVKFRKLADDFQKIIDKSKVGDNNFLSTDGLTDIFMAVGLDKETSASIAAIFEKFVTPKDDTNLASEGVEGKKPLVIPASAFSGRSSPAEYEMQKLTNYGGIVEAGAITSVNNIFLAPDSILGQNPTSDAVFTLEAGSGTLSSQPPGSMPAGARLMAVNESSGYSVIASTADPFAFNPSGVEQLFLLDDKGSFAGQLTANDGAYTYTSADMAASDDYFGVVAYDGGQYYVMTLSIAEGSSPPGDEIVLDRNTDEIGGLKMSNSGGFVLYTYLSGGTYSLNHVSTEDSSMDGSIAGVVSSNPIRYGFSRSDGSVIYAAQDIITGLSDINFYDRSFGAISNLVSGVNLQDLAVLERVDDGVEESYYSTIEIDDSSVPSTFLYMVESDGVLRGHGDNPLFPSVSGSEAFYGLSMAYSAADSSEVDIGLVAKWYGLAGDSDREMYRVTYRPAVTGRSLNDDSTNYSEILDSNRHITSRPAAYRLLSDLKALREQISANVGALENAFEVVSQNIELVRATGLALLDIGNSITSADTAASVAESLRQRIRRQAPEALAQAENLDPIAVATLTYTGKGN